MKNNNWLITVVVAIIIGAVAFYGGMQYQKTQRGQFGSFANGQAGFGRQGSMMGRFGANGTRPVTGDILSVDSNSMTVKLSDGSSKIVLLSQNTSINKAAKGSVSDLKAGERVAAFGTANSDGSITAQNIQLNPTVRTGGSANSTPSAQ